MTEDWITVRQHLPAEGQECVLICCDLLGKDIHKAVGYRLNAEWTILHPELTTWRVLAWLPLSPTPKVL